MGRRIMRRLFLFAWRGPRLHGGFGWCAGGRVVWRLALQGFGWVMEVKVPAFAGMTGGVGGNDGLCLLVFLGVVGGTGVGWAMRVWIPRCARNDRGAGGMAGRFTVTT